MNSEEYNELSEAGSVLQESFAQKLASKTKTFPEGKGGDAAGIFV